VPAGEKFAQAAALAGTPLPAIDFLHSRLTPPKQSRVARRTAAIVAAAVLVIGGGAFLWWDWTSGQNEVAMLTQQVAAIKVSTRQAQEKVDTVAFARTWFDQRPRFLDCLRELAMAFPEDNRIWATSLSIKEDMLASLSGKSVNESAAMEVLDRLKQNTHFVDFKPAGMTAGTGNSKDVSFVVSVVFRGAK
jgi:hypothetical protein